MFPKCSFPLSGLSVQIYLAFAVNLNSLSTGLFASWTSLRVELAHNKKGPDENPTTEMNLIATLPFFGAMLAISCSSYVMTKIGRKLTISFGSLLQVIVWLLLVISDNKACIYVGLFLRGIPSLIFTQSGTIYVAEVTEPSIRGAAISSILALRCFGMWLSYVFVMFASEATVAMVGGGVSLSAFVLFLPAPESPYHFLLRNEEGKARHALEILRGNVMDRETELRDIKIMAEQTEASDRKALLELFRSKSTLRATFLSLAVVSIQVFTGIDWVETYIVVIFSSTPQIISSRASSLIYILLKTITSVIGLFLVDRIGRRPLLIYSTSTISLILFMGGLYFYLQDALHFSMASYSWIMIVILGLFVIIFSLGMGSATISFATELLPTRFRNTSSAIILFLVCIEQISVLSLYSILKSCCGLYLIFWVHSIILLIGATFCIAFVRETAKKSLKEIQESFK